jgi:hypothetical protein
MSIDILEADFDSMEACASIVLLGKRRTGKTTWAKMVLTKINKNVDRFVAMCGSKDTEGEWKKIISPLFVMQKDLAYLQRLRDYQDRKCEHLDHDLPIPRKLRICVIVDDCGADRKFMHNPIIKDILSNGRHYGMDVLFLCQYLNQMHCENRSQIDYLCMLYTSNAKNMKKVFDEYIGIGDYRTYKYVLNACTVNRGMLVIDSTKCASVLEDCVFFKRMTWPMQFQRVGSESVRKYGLGHYLDHSTSKAIPTNRKKESPLLSNRNHVNVDDVDTDSDNESPEEVHEGTSKLSIHDIPSLFLADKMEYNDKKGSFTVQKHFSKQKTE